MDSENQKQNQTEKIGAKWSIKARSQAIFKNDANDVW